MSTDRDPALRLGLWYGLGAFGLWGVFPLYFKTLVHVPPAVVLAHRVVWSAALLAVAASLLHRWGELRTSLAAPRTWIFLGCSTLLIAVNWYVFIEAVSTKRVIETSLGYYMTPLANVFLGCVVLRERLRPVQLGAILLAALGVGVLAMGVGEWPWIAISLCVSFSLYGLLRKLVQVDSLLGLLFETCALCPIALCFLAWQYRPETAAAAGAAVTDPATLCLLALGGPITSIPLLLFAASARRLQLTTLGILQYLAPTLQFLLAVVLFGEPFNGPRLASFLCIWLAVGLYTWDSLRGYRARAPAT